MGLGTVWNDALVLVEFSQHILVGDLGERKEEDGQEGGRKRSVCVCAGL